MNDEYIKKIVQSVLMDFLNFALQVIGVGVILAVIFWIANVEVMIKIFGSYLFAGLSVSVILAMIYQKLIRINK